MANHIQQIQALQEKVQTNKESLIRLEEQLKGIKEERNKILASLKELGIEEKDLEKEIVTKEEDLKSKIQEIENELK